MATHDYVLANASGAAFRADLNNALAAIVSNNSSATEPATTYPYMWWMDTTANQLKQRNATNDGWIMIRDLGANEASNTVVSGSDLGAIWFQDGSGGNYAAIQGQGDGTAGTNDYPGRLVFSTTADGDSSPTERMRIAQDGRIFFDQARFDAGGGLWLTPSSFDRVVQRCGTSTTGSASLIEFINPNGLVGSITVNGSATAYNTSSDYRLKENVTPVTDGITRLQQLKPSRFNFIADPDKIVDGFLAHDVQDVVPEAITGEKDAVDDEGNPQYQGIDQSKLVPLLTAALQEAIAKIETLEAKVAALEAN